MTIRICSRNLGTRFAYLAVGLLIFALSTGVSLADPDNRPIVVLREDDIRDTWRMPFVGLGGVTGLAYGKSKHIPITWGVITDCATGGWGLTWAQLTDYMATAGGELASHSCTHSTLPTSQDYIDELVNSKAAIESHVPGYTCKTFLQPGPWSGDAYLDRYWELDNPIGQAIQANYSQSMAYLGGGGHIGNPAYRYGISNDGALDYGASTTTAGILQTLDIIANTPGIIFVFSCHGVQETGGTETIVQGVPADVLKAFMDRCAELRDSGKIRLMGLNDAYQATFSSTLNHVPDPGFDLCSPGSNNPFGPITCSAGCTLPPTGGRGNSRYMQMPASNTMDNVFRLDPGRYKVTWWQKPGPTGGSLMVRLQLTNLGGTGVWSAMSGSSFGNSDPNSWELKSAHVLVPSGFSLAYYHFQTLADAPFGVDDLSVVSDPLDTAVSPTNTVVTPTATTCKVEWDTPAGFSGDIVVCYYNGTHPLTKDAGTPFGSITALPGTHQQIFVDQFTWSSGSGYRYFSVFAVKSGVGSPPDLAVIQLKPDKLLLDLLVQQDLSVQLSWHTTYANADIATYSYAVGTSSGGHDVIGWTNTSDTSVTLPGRPRGRLLYFSVKAKSKCENWSDIATASATIGTPSVIGDALGSPDGSSVTICGTVSAILGNCYYVETPWRSAGVRVQGGTGAHEGDTVTVSGSMTSADGERAVIPDPPSP